MTKHCLQLKIKFEFAMIGTCTLQIDSTWNYFFFFWLLAAWLAACNFLSSFSFFFYIVLKLVIFNVYICVYLQLRKNKSKVFCLHFVSFTVASQHFDRTQLSMSDDVLMQAPCLLITNSCLPTLQSKLPLFDCFCLQVRSGICDLTWLR